MTGRKASVMVSLGWPRVKQGQASR